ITVYSSNHYDGSWADGLSLGCENSSVHDNGIVDATDVGIVVFTAYPANQRSIVEGNQVISAGNSAYGAYAFDPLDRGVTPNFTGARFSYNSMWTSPNTHFIIGLAVGTRAWFYNGAVGFGGEFSNNTT